jgi:hypothetical protein
LVVLQRGICGMDSDWINSLTTSSFGLLERSSATTGRFCRNDPPPTRIGFLVRGTKVDCQTQDRSR